jgi:hypothetical protein
MQQAERILNLRRNTLWLAILDIDSDQSLRAITLRIPVVSWAFSFESLLHRIKSPLEASLIGDHNWKPNDKTFQVTSSGPRSRDMGSHTGFKHYLAIFSFLILYIGLPLRRALKAGCISVAIIYKIYRLCLMGFSFFLSLREQT